MRKFKNIKFTIRVFLGSAIMIHGLCRIFFIKDYLDVLLASFNNYANQELLILIGTLFPFVEFLLGALLFFRIGVKRSAIGALLISIIMGAVVILGQLSMLRLVYHIIITGALSYVIFAHTVVDVVRDLINRSKGKINSLR